MDETYAPKPLESHVFQHANPMRVASSREVRRAYPPRSPSRRLPGQEEEAEDNKSPSPSHRRSAQRANSRRLENSEEKKTSEAVLEEGLPSPPTVARKPSAHSKKGEHSSPPESTRGLSTTIGGGKGEQKAENGLFVGENTLQYALWAHYMSYGAALLCGWLGVFSILWLDAHTYKCKINGELINSKYLLTPSGTCSNSVTMSDGTVRNICCDPNKVPPLPQGDFPIGVLYIVYSLWLVLTENFAFGFGLYYPNNSISYRWRISPMGILNVLVGGVGLYRYVTVLAGACLVCLAAVQFHAVRRGECGDGGRAQQRATRSKKKGSSWSDMSGKILSCLRSCPDWNPYTFFVRIYNEDKLSTYVWLFLYAAGNVTMFIYTLFAWYAIVDSLREGLAQGTLDLGCSDRLCHVNRKVLRYGPISNWAPWAKACGGLLNLNSALLLLPVIRLLLRKLNNVGVSFSALQNNTDFFAKFLARPLTRYIPLQKNIEFHKICAAVIFVNAFAHGIFHYFNLITADAATLTLFRMFKWNGTAFLTGTIVSFSMFFIYSAAPDCVRHAKYEIFFYSHHWFCVYFVAMFLHGPVFFYWTALPVLLYLWERYLQSSRGTKPFVVSKVEWIPPVMAIYFRPVFKRDFTFKEGQYLYLNCPHVNPKEWHPFTISSAVDDLDNGPRIDLTTGEEVMEVPRPSNLPAGAKWNKYCLVSQDWRTMSVHNYLEKSDTGYMDYVSVHVKVHGLEDKIPRSWTRRFKDYLELLQPGGKFPFYFSTRDHRGDVTIGKQLGPDGLQILCVDGPHSAPSEHYTSYGTVMLIGAGIGLTPCASILTALLRYRWRMNFNPEIVHFYWVVRHAEVDSFQWLVHLLTELSFELKKGRHSGQIEKKYYCEINIYVTATDNVEHPVAPLYRASRKLGLEEAAHGLKVSPTFTAEQLYGQLVNPLIDSKGQLAKMKNPHAPNRLQDLWIWSGRPQWDEIFREMKEQRQHSDIGVCFCGAPAIGADLRSMCERYSSVKEDCIFTLHKENF